MAIQVKNFLEWDSTALLLEEQRVQTFEEYIEQLYKFLSDLKSQRERLTELTEELETKEEDIYLMSDLMKKKDKENKDLKEATEKMMAVIKASKASKQEPRPITPITTVPIAEDAVEDMQEIKSPHEELMKGLGERVPRKKKNIKCEQCGKVEYRKTNAKYCIECKIARKRKRDRVYQKKKYEDGEKYDSRGDVVEDTPDEPSAENATEGNQEEPKLDEDGKYEDADPEDEDKTNK